MYTKVLVPLDGSGEAEAVLPKIRGELAPDGEVILLRVIAPARSHVVGGHLLSADQLIENERSRAMTYLKRVIDKLEGDIERWRREVAVRKSVAEAIADFARQEEADLIAMYTHDRKGLARLIKGSVAREVQRMAETEVKNYGPRDLAGAS